MKINQSLRKKIKTAIITEIKKEELKNAVLITPYPLDQNRITVFYEVFPFLKQKKIETICDEKLIAGFILKWESKIIDASLSGRINALVKNNLVS